MVDLTGKNWVLCLFTNYSFRVHTIPEVIVRTTAIQAIQVQFYNDQLDLLMLDFENDLIFHLFPGVFMRYLICQDEDIFHALSYGKENFLLN